MQQRTYQGNVSVAGLADFLVQHYDPQHNVQAQTIGQGDSLMVQIGHGDTPDKIKHALSVGIIRTIKPTPGLVVTMGQQQWISPHMAAYAAMMGLIGALVTPWALFALLWPVSELIGSRALPGDVWDSIDTYVIGQGATLAQTDTLTHPHLDQTQTTQPGAATQKLSDQ